MGVSLKFASALLVSLLVQSPAIAQMDWVGPMTNGAIAGQVAENAMDNMGIPKDGRDTSASPRPQSRPISVKTTYKLDKRRSQTTLNTIVENVRSENPAEGARIANLFASVDIMAMIDQALSEKNLSRSNTAHAMAVYWMNMWQYANGDFSDKPIEAYLAVASQVSRSMSSNPDFAQLSDQQKQEMAETMLVQAALMGASVDEVRGNPKLQRQMAVAARASAERTGLDVDRVVLTAQGFVPAKPRKRSDASDVVPGEERALAANDAGGDSGDSAGPNYALIAGAAGAGLGLAFLIGKAMGKKG